jgi:uncharacterized protein with von Willebrand factor type A (vWA) domain
MRAVAGACNQAKEDVGKFQDATDALGLGAGSPGAPLDPARLAAAFKRVQNSERLKAIANLAGRFRRVAQSKQRAKLDHGLDDVVGVEPGGDLSRVLPVELARLGDDDLELDVLRRLVERQAQCREWHAVTPVGKGPIVVCVDESGSMTGPKIATAKALALALVWIARRQRRWVGLVGFSGGTQGTVFVCPPDKNDENGLCDWLEHFFGQGTELDVPLRELPAMWAKMGAPKGKTDVLLVTDAIVQCGADLAASFNAWKKTAQARVFALVIGGAQAGDLTLVSDEVHAVNAIDASSDAVGAVLSV